MTNNPSKFKRLLESPTPYREAKLQRFSIKLKNPGCLDDNMYWKIFPKSSQPARFYDLPKLHKHRETNESPPIWPIVSSINSYNYKLAKYLCSILSPLKPSDHTTKDSFSFVEDFLSFNSSASDKNFSYLMT